MRGVLYLFILFSTYGHADYLDEELDQYIKDFKFAAVKKPSNTNPKKYLLGRKLFFDKILSGNKDISCSSCHSPDLGTGDFLPLSAGVNGVMIPRNSPALYNIAHKKLKHFFWDGRVSYNPKHDVYNTPNESLNGDYPERWDITEALGSGVAAQAIFPLLSHEEMRGPIGSNELANGNSDEEVWSLIMKRVLSLKEYTDLFKEAFPSTTEFNIGHLGNALAYFQKIEFSVNDTPWDKYLRGDKKALSDDEKRGAILFSTKAKCSTCHKGELLGGSQFANIASPQAGPGKDIVKNDEGRFYVTKNEKHKYMFKVPMLRNVNLTAPYFHSGVYENLEDVVNHYIGGIKSIDNFDGKWLYEIYGGEFFIETNPYKIFKKKESAHPIIRKNQIKLSETEKNYLLQFLRKSLTSSKNL